jgi:toxin ParE1/3/4
MSFVIFKSVQAARDIEEAFVYIAEENLDKGVYFLVAVEETLELLAEQPFVGSQRNFPNKKFENMRMWRVKGFENYLVFYTVEENLIKIFRLVNAKRDFHSIFE